MTKAKILTTLYFLAIIQLIVRGLAIGNNGMIFFGLLNIIILYFFFPTIKNWITTQTNYFFRIGLHLTTEQYTLLRTGTIYIFNHYIFLLSIIYLLVSSIDYLFANILFLNMRLGIFMLILSVLVIRTDIIKGDIRLADRKISKSDGVFLLACIIGICLLLSFQTLPFYQNYLYSIAIARGSWVIFMLVTKFTSWKNIFRNDIFIIGFGLSTIFFFVWLWNISPNIKQSLTHEEIVIQTGYIYGNCPTDLPK